jgi:hypothetical protein
VRTARRSLGRSAPVALRPWPSSPPPPCPVPAGRRAGGRCGGTGRCCSECVSAAVVRTRASDHLSDVGIGVPSQLRWLRDHERRSACRGLHGDVSMGQTSKFWSRQSIVVVWRYEAPMCWMAIGPSVAKSGNNKAAQVLHDADAVPGRMQDVALRAGDTDAARKAKSIVGEVAAGLGH